MAYAEKQIDPFKVPLYKCRIAQVAIGPRLPIYYSRSPHSLFARRGVGGRGAKDPLPSLIHPHLAQSPYVVGGPILVRRAVNGPI